MISSSTLDTATRLAALERENERLTLALTQIADDCEALMGVEGISLGEKTTWKAVSRMARRAAETRL